ncbi:hypothetical protein J2X73_003977 [Novosphingobium sp. 1748]|nr:hypothetical protein [Novosphingobium sp. 1748]
MPPAGKGTQSLCNPDNGVVPDGPTWCLEHEK